MSKSVNKIWRESGTQLPFKEWLAVYNKAKMKTGAVALPFDGNATAEMDVFKSVPASHVDMFKSTPAVADFKNADATDATTVADTSASDSSQLQLKTTASSGSILGLNTTVLIFSAVIIAGAIGYHLYTKRKG